MNVALLEKGRGKKDGEKPGADQQAGERHDQPQLSIALLKVRELLADPGEYSFSLSLHPATALPISN
jgi:hypothetical protein